MALTQERILRIVRRTVILAALAAPVVTGFRWGLHEQQIQHVNHFRQMIDARGGHAPTDQGMAVSNAYSPSRS